MATEQEIHENGRRYERARLCQELAQEKIEFILDLYRKASTLADTFPAESPKKLEWRAYAEGLRHALNIFKNYGAPEGAYKNLIKNSMEFPPEPQTKK